MPTKCQRPQNESHIDNCNDRGWFRDISAATLPCISAHLKNGVFSTVSLSESGEPKQQTPPATRVLSRHFPQLQKLQLRFAN